MTDLNLADIQGLILRGYRMPLVRHFVLQVTAARPARALLAKLAAQDGTARMGITNATTWSREKPSYCLNLGITWSGLLALGLGAIEELSFRSFPAFVAGSASRARELGDTEESAPEHWVGGLGTGDDHVLLSLHARDEWSLASSTALLRDMFTQTGAFREVHCFDGRSLPDWRTHFGFRDGIAQPNIEGTQFGYAADAQPVSAAWNFVLLNEAPSYDVPTPVKLGLNGSFGVFRVLQQDVAAFDRFLRAHSDRIDPELLAAKMCGRWRNGVPLALSPDTDAPDRPIPEENLNNFDYVPSEYAPDAVDDQRGVRCPLGAHVRRSNPRSQDVLGGRGHFHRLVRRGMPYGPAYQPGAVDDGIERGLLGYFINASIESQFEFIQKTWMNSGGFAVGLDAHEKDPIAGDNDPDESSFEIPSSDPRGPLKLVGLPRFVTTRGCAYVFLPSITAIRYLSEL